MTRDILMRDVWNLRTSPFAPRVGRDGVSLPADAVVHILDPNKDPRALQYYFDVYDWSASPQVRELSPDSGLRVFPSHDELPEALMILISGHQDTGCNSLVNLVQHRIATISRGSPLLVDVSLAGFQNARHLELVAGQILFAVENCGVKGATKAASALDKQHSRVSQSEAGQPNATYAGFFSACRQVLLPLKIEIVLKISHGGAADNWVAVYEAINSFASHVLVLTQDRPRAKTCYQQMLNRNHGISWIEAQKLDLPAGLEYVAERVAKERLDNPGANGDAYPFTVQAIEALYERGSRNQGEIVEYPIGWLRLRLNDAFDAKLDALVKAGAEPDKVDREQTIIDANTVRAVCSLRNKGA